MLLQMPIRSKLIALGKCGFWANKIYGSGSCRTDTYERHNCWNCLRFIRSLVSMSALGSRKPIPR
jgi:hypothetical protein